MKYSKNSTKNFNFFFPTHKPKHTALFFIVVFPFYDDGYTRILATSSATHNNFVVSRILGSYKLE